MGTNRLAYLTAEVCGLDLLWFGLVCQLCTFVLLISDLAVRAQFICPTAPLSSKHSWPQDRTSLRSKSFSSPLLDSGEVCFWSTQPEIWSSGNPSVRRPPFRQIHWSKKIWSLDFVAICGEADHQLRRLCTGPPTTMAPGGRGINLRDWEQTLGSCLPRKEGKGTPLTWIQF